MVEGRLTLPALFLVCLYGPVICVRVLFHDKTKEQNQEKREETAEISD